MLLHFSAAEAQETVDWKELSPVAQIHGRAGMFAGVSHEKLLIMGGADFPNGYPWEGGKKKWHKEIFTLTDDEGWVSLADQLPHGLAYGVSVSYRDKIIMVGGSDETMHYDRAIVLELGGEGLEFSEYPKLPQPLANMAGALVGHVIIVAGGMHSPISEPTNACYLLDLENIAAGWIVLPPCPGPGRAFPVAASNGRTFFLFSGENEEINAAGLKQRHILQDAYKFSFDKIGSHWKGTWHRLADIPKGFSAAASPAPFIEAGYFVLWGGVDRITALHTDPVTHPGIPNTFLNYYPKTDSWEQKALSPSVAGRVTLPTVVYRGYAYYINGEIRPGVRTNQVIGLSTTH